jgi:hypothetical protein
MNYVTIRKNASKKIDSLIERATYITLETQSMGLDDCWNSNGDEIITAERVREFMFDHYNELIVRLHQDNEGNDLYLNISDGPYYFCDEIRVHFTPKPIENIDINIIEPEPAKPKMSYSQVKSFLAAGFTSPLNHGAKRVEVVGTETVAAIKQIKQIRVMFSESSHFNDIWGEIIDRNDYEQRVWRTLHDYRKRHMSGYFKTELELTLSDGTITTYRHDICPKEAKLEAMWSSYVDWCAEKARERMQNECINH